MAGERPGEWGLLAYPGDPIPKDPVDVDDEARHYKGVATKIADQIARLKDLAEPDERLKGSYAPELQKNCSELQENLGKIKGRFEKVGNALATHAEHVKTARATTASALHDVEVVKQAQAAKPPEKSGGGGGQPDDPYKDAKSKAHGAMHTFGEQAEQIADRIRAASDDDMKDSTWDKFKDFVSKVAKVLDAIADIIGYIAAALVIISLFIPGLNLLTLAVLLTVAALAIHTLLAATGNGSWLDVALDVFSLATMGTGSALGASAKAAGKVALRTAGKTAGKTAAKSALAKASFNSGKGVLGKFSMARQFFRGSTQEAMSSAYKAAYRKVISTKFPVVPKTTLTQLVKHPSTLPKAFPNAAGLRASFKVGGGDLTDQMLRISTMRNLGLKTGFAFPAKTYGAAAVTHLGNLSVLGPKAMDPDIGPWFDPYDVPAYDSISSSMKWVPGGPY